jgi:hypothetical protein
VTDKLDFRFFDPIGQATDRAFEVLYQLEFPSDLGTMFQYEVERFRRTSASNCRGQQVARGFPRGAPD